MTDLKHLMDQATDHGPSHGIDLGAVLDAGHRRVRRRRTGTVVGAAALVAAVSAGVALGPALHSGDRVSPAGPPRPLDQVVTTADATFARQGEQYSPLSTETTVAPDRDNGVVYSDVLDDGSVVFEDGPSLRTGTYTAGLLDPRSGESTPLLELQDSDRPGDYVGTSERWMVWTQNNAGYQTRPGFFLLDRQSGEHTVLDLQQGPAASLGFGSFDLVRRAELGPDDRVYFTTEDADTTDLWSVSLPDGGSPRREATVGDFDVDGNLLTFVDRRNAPADQIDVRDLLTGEEWAFDAGDDDRCSLLSLERSSDLLLLQETCREPEELRLRVVDATDATEAASLVTIHGQSVEAGALTEDHLTFLDHSEVNRGVYVYDLGSGDLWQVSSDRPADDPSTRGHGDVLTWATVGDDDRRPTLTVVDFGL